MQKLVGTARTIESLTQKVTLPIASLISVIKFYRCIVGARWGPATVERGAAVIRVYAA